MKTGKRILSVLLAVLMMASCLTFAFAAEEKEEPLYVTYKLPYSDTWNEVRARYQQPCDYGISAIIGVDPQDYKFNPSADPEQRPSYLLVRADYNRPFYIYVTDNQGTGHCYEIKGFQYSSCKTASSGSYYCTWCQQTLPVTFPATHVYTNWVTRSKATCLDGEVNSRYCARCNAVETHTDEPLGHNFVTGDPVPATCFTEGYTPEECTRCHKVLLTNTVPATTKHKDENKDNHCDVCGTLMNNSEETQTAEEKAPKKNIFQRIIDWFKNLFKKLFK